MRRPHDGDPAPCAADLLGRDPGHLPEAIIREILGLPFFDSLQNKAGDEFGLVAIGVMDDGPPSAGFPILFWPKLVAVMNG